MTTLSRRGAALLLATSVLTVGVVGALTGTSDAAPKGCTAVLAPFEDGSWSGQSLRYNGRLVAKRWEVAGPDKQGRVIKGTAYTEWTPSWKGTRCKVTLGGWED